jgi:hypothetical protein
MIFREGYTLSYPSEEDAPPQTYPLILWGILKEFMLESGCLYPLNPHTLS